MSWLSAIFGGRETQKPEAIAGQPERLTILPDEYHLPHVGHMRDGRQAFLTSPFVPDLGDRTGCEYLALYVFDADGLLVEHKITSLGQRSQVDEDEAQRLKEELIASVSPLSPRGISVRPFSITHDGVEFGLIPRQPDDEDEDWSVEAQPGNYIAFTPPWHEGGYDT